MKYSIFMYFNVLSLGVKCVLFNLLMCLNQQVSNPALVQEVFGWGWLSWGNSGHATGPLTLESLVQLGIAQVCCAERCFLALTRSGKVYVCPYSGEGQVLYTDPHSSCVYVTSLLMSVDIGDFEKFIFILFSTNPGFYNGSVSHINAQAVLV